MQVATPSNLFALKRRNKSTLQSSVSRWLLSALAFNGAEGDIRPRAAKPSVNSFDQSD
jgi:hypothetical protein